jgi:hypothetical protein
MFVVLILSCSLRDNTSLPISVYHVSGEYAMLKAAAERGWLNEKDAALEALMCFRRWENLDLICFTLMFTCMLQRFKSAQGGAQQQQQAVAAPWWRWSSRAELHTNMAAFYCLEHFAWLTRCCCTPLLCCSVYTQYTVLRLHTAACMCMRVHGEAAAYIVFALSSSGECATAGAAASSCPCCC